LTDLLLTSELKGYVEQPNYYFLNPTEKTNSDLDLVMLTHGYRRFEWKKILSNERSPISFQPEMGIQIKGLVETTNGKPIPNGTVSLISTKGSQPLTNRIDNTGNFSFDNLQFTDSARFVLSAIDAEGNNKTKIIYNKRDIAALSVKNAQQKDDAIQISNSYLENSKKLSEENSKFGTVNGVLLKEVQIKQKKIKEDSYPSSNLAGPGHADQVIHRSEFKGGGQFSDQFSGILRGVKFTGPNGQKVAFLNSGLGSGPMLLVVDGSILPLGSPVDEVNVNNIETIEVLKGANASVYGMDGGNGVLAITTRKGSGFESKDIVSTGVLPIVVKGFYKAREFYAPKYDHKNDGFIHNDLRSTIYWKPELVTDKNGNASFNYYNGDGSGNYRIIIEGIDEMGNLGRREYLYMVK
jgi:TonB-dependent SusC/RagA subfamily outer membrane receptor